MYDVVFDCVLKCGVVWTLIHKITENYKNIVVITVNALKNGHDLY